VDAVKFQMYWNLEIDFCHESTLPYILYSEEIAFGKDEDISPGEATPRKLSILLLRALMRASKRISRFLLE
jgi:hypothetical protein